MCRCLWGHGFCFSGVITPGGPASSPLFWYWASALFSFSHSDRCTVKPHLGLPGPWPTRRGPAPLPSTPVPHPHPPTHPGCLERMSMRTGFPGPVCKTVCMSDSWGYWGWRWVGTVGDRLPLSTDYPWRWSQAVPMNSALIKWLYLPDFFSAPNATNLISESPAPHAHTPLTAMLRLCRCPWDGQRVGTDPPLQPARGPSPRPHQAVQSCHSLWGLCPVNVPHPTGTSHVYTFHHTDTSAPWCGHRCACRCGHRRTRVWRLMPHGIVRLMLASFPDACGLCV